MKAYSRPYVVAKIAQTIDGKTATRAGQSQWITSAAARQFARRKRDGFDAILVGINTVLKDDPLLTGLREKGLRKIVLDSRLRIPLSARIFSQAAPGQCLILTTRQAGAKKVRKLRDRGVSVFLCPQKSAKVDLTKVFAMLKQEGISRLLVEGGARVIGQALKARLVDELHIYMAPFVFGDQRALNGVKGLVPELIKDSVKLDFKTVRRVGPDIFIQADVYRNR
jgi:diaminohydroxyphosphoribosylaminopyrimidine deaminase/5-amino-6-(5-phosphoribosylamino)uracil reductase